MLHVLGHLASAPFSGAGRHWWHGLPSVHLAGVAPLGAGFATSNVGRRRFSPYVVGYSEGRPPSVLAASPQFLDARTQVMVVVIGKAGVRCCPFIIYFRLYSRI